MDSIWPLKLLHPRSPLVLPKVCGAISRKIKAAAAAVTATSILGFMLAGVYLLEAIVLWHPACWRIFSSIFLSSQYSGPRGIARRNGSAVARDSH